MQIEGHTNAWAIGDCAYIVNAFDNKPAPTTAQFAERQGRQAALNLVRVLKGEPTQPFRFKALGQLCSIGGYQAVAEMFGMRVSVAWCLPFQAADVVPQNQSRLGLVLGLSFSPRSQLPQY